jgi:hypothetical protein
VVGDRAGQCNGWITAALAEYEAHRAEVLAEAQGQQQTLALGATAVGILIAGAFNVWDDRLLAASAFFGAIPLLCVLVLMQWTGRAFGMMRVGAYLEGLENALRTAYPAAPPPVLTWESMLLTTRPSKKWRPHYGWNDFGAGAVFVLLAAGSIALGAYRGYAEHEELVAALAGVEALLLGLFAATLARSLAIVREEARRDLPLAGESAPRS